MLLHYFGFASYSVLPRIHGIFFLLNWIVTASTSSWIYCVWLWMIAVHSSVCRPSSAGVLNPWPATSNQGRACPCSGMVEQQAQIAIDGLPTCHPRSSECIDQVLPVTEAGGHRGSWSCIRQSFFVVPAPVQGRVIPSALGLIPF